MTKSVRRLLVCALAAVLALGLLATPGAMAQTGDYKILVVGRTLGFRHSHIPVTTNALIALGQQHGFTVDVWDPAQSGLTLPSTPFTSAEDLAKYATIVFVSPVDGTNDLNPNRPRLLNDSELAAFQGYIRNGGGFVGLHAATDTMHTVPWYSQLTGGGARFRNHPAQQTATMRVESPTHPSTEMLPKEWVRFDEWYNYTTNPREDVHVLMTLDESTYNPGFGAMGEDHPIAWCHNFEGGRSWYQGAGHTDASYSDPLFLAHLLAGIEWTAGRVSGGGNCVTWGEVDELVDALGTANAKSAAATRNVSRHLDRAEAAADEGDRKTAVRELRVARTLADALVPSPSARRTLVEKIEDLIDWQQGLADNDM